jgi:hypothetical protein
MVGGSCHLWALPSRNTPFGGSEQEFLWHHELNRGSQVPNGPMKGA